MGFFPIGAVVCERVYDQVSEQPIKPVGKKTSYGAIAQLGERLPCTQEVGGSIPPGSTTFRGDLLHEVESSNERKSFPLKIFAL